VIEGARNETRKKRLPNIRLVWKGGPQRIALGDQVEEMAPADPEAGSRTTRWRNRPWMLLSRGIIVETKTKRVKTLFPESIAAADPGILD
jgi:hypothetical protein